MPWGLGSWGVGSWGIGGGTDYNLGFEEPGASPGIPDKWNLVPTATAIEYLEFSDTDPDTTVVIETFSWGAVAILEPIWALLAWTGGVDVETFDSWSFGLVENPALSAVIFNTLSPPTDIVETFETYWFGNQNYKSEFVGVGTDLTAVVFTDTTDVEDFEDGWDNDSYLTQFVGVGTDLTALTFDGTAAWAGPTEDWEEVKLDDPFFVDPTTETLQLTTPHGLVINDVVYLLNENGSLPSGLLTFPTPWYVYIVPSGATLRVASTTNPPATGPQNITDFGTGSHRVKFDISRYWTDEI
jgi:hypothetical protein